MRLILGGYPFKVMTVVITKDFLCLTDYLTFICSVIELIHNRVCLSNYLILVKSKIVCTQYKARQCAMNTSKGAKHKKRIKRKE